MRSTVATPVADIAGLVRNAGQVLLPGGDAQGTAKQERRETRLLLAKMLREQCWLPKTLPTDLG
ncbi:hypothetical protein [Nostoc sp.]|uniref:hypothetical protein n=1 Tax=Nostoc sp. TaxID=1180 RepID=UPI002FF93E1D